MWYLIVSFPDLCLLSYFDPKEIKYPLSDARTEVSKKKAGLDFDDSASLNDDDYYNLTGIARAQFDNLSGYLCDVKFSQF